MVIVRRALVILFAGTLGYSGATWGQALSSNEPSGRVGRLAFTQGTVSYHDSQRTDWEPATINQPMSTGDAIWTEPGAHSEVSIAGTRVRLDGATQLDMVALDDQRTRLQVDQGRVDIKTVDFDNRQPYEIVTPRGVASLQQQGDYYVEAGSTQDPTRLGVRQGAAQFQAPDGRTLAVRAGEVAEVSGDGSTMQLHTIKAPPPPMPQYWAQRDRVVAYEQPPQYLSAGVTGYEDLNYYGTWNNDPEYGQVWSARNVPVGWSPYTTGRWVYQPVYGWTWVDEQPWGFAPYHYGRWAQRNNRWFWVPPERSQRAVYAPALVAFIGGTELGIALGMQPRRPVGWFPLGPREIYVPPYYSNRDYYRRLNIAARIQDQILEERWERAQRREAIAEQNWQNRRFATVVPADAFARSQRVESVRLRVDATKLAAAPVAAVALPPSPTVSVRAVQTDTASARDATPDRTQRPGEARKPDEPRTGATAQDRANAREARAEPATLQAIKPEPQAKKAPGPQVVSRSAVTTTTDAKVGTDAKASTDAKAGADAKTALPALAPRNAKAPPQAQIKGEREPQQATAPANRTDAPKPGEPAKPVEPQAKPAEPRATAPANRPDATPRAGDKAQPGQANLPPVRDRNAEPPKAAATPNATAPTAQPPKPNEAPKPPQATNAPAPKAAEPPRAQPAPRQATPPAPPPPPREKESHATPPPQAAPQAQPQRQAAPPPQQPQPRESHAAPPPQQAAPQPQPQRQAAPPPQPHPAPAPQQAQSPKPQPQPQAQPQPPQRPQRTDDKKDDKK